ncbi:MAG: hypothetical protein WHX52_10160 [Anaerolineae bacterium]
MSEPFVGAMFAVAILVVVGVAYAGYRRDKRRIYTYLHSRGATDITITKVWFGGSERHNEYDVTYTDNRQQQHQNRCMIPSGLFYDGSIYWKDDVPY